MYLPVRTDSIEILAPKNALAYGDVEYLYLTFSSESGARGFNNRASMNYTVYDPSGNVIHSEAFRGVPADFGLIIVADVEGTYIFKLENTGQLPINATVMLGYNQVGWTRPFFLVCFDVAIYGLQCMLALTAILGLRFSRRMKPDERRI